MDRLDLAKGAYASAKGWAEDSLAIQLCEAWIGLRQGGDQEAPGYQAAFYCYDEMSGMPSANNPVVLNGKAVAQAARHRWPEAEAPLQEASTIVGRRRPSRVALTDHHVTYQNANDGTTLANSAALAILTGKASASAQYLAALQSIKPRHPLLTDLAAKDAAFDEAAAKFAVAVA